MADELHELPAPVMPAGAEPAVSSEAAEDAQEEVHDGSRKRRRLDDSGAAAVTLLERPADEEVARKAARIVKTLPAEAPADLLAKLAARYPQVYDEILRVANSDADARKVFVRGLAWETTEADLRQAVVEFGPVDDVSVAMDRATGRSRGFGFVTFTSIDGAVACVDRGERQLQNRTVHFVHSTEKRKEDPARAGGMMMAPAMGGYGAGASRGYGQQGYGGGYGQGGYGGQSYVDASGGTVCDKSLRKFLVRGIPWESTDLSLRVPFEIYGPVEESAVIYDKETRRSKGYGFVTFRYLESANACAANPPTRVDGRDVQIILAAIPPGGAPMLPSQLYQQQQAGGAAATTAAAAGYTGYAGMMQGYAAAPTGLAGAAPSVMGAVAQAGQGYGQMAQMGAGAAAAYPGYTAAAATGWGRQ